MLNRALRRFLRLLWRLIWRGALGFVVLSVALVLLFRFVPPPGSIPGAGCLGSTCEGGLKRAARLVQ